MHQERLRRKFDAGALRQNHAATVDDVEDGNRLARFALRVERIAAEIYQVQSDAEDQQDGPRVARLGDEFEPIRSGIAGRLARGRGSRLGIGARNLFSGEFQNLE